MDWFLYDNGLRHERAKFSQGLTLTHFSKTHKINEKQPLDQTERG